MPRILGTGRGSSPLARGLPSGCPGRSRGRRIIPARAGFTRRTIPPPNFGTDHPRSRGVYGRGIEPRYGLRGSSPLARGLLPASPRERGRIRIIPARAGFTTDKTRVTPHTKDHPRSRGVYTQSMVIGRQRGGSSPLARGLPRPVGESIRFRRIIPARAGFTPPYPTQPTSGTDHPRSRGVYWVGLGMGVGRKGSSPLARGLPTIPRPGIGAAGIIPARAGFTENVMKGTWCGGDHPRSRGVYPASPRERGRIRIIPARAGFTVSACDENWIARGSSPLARGLPIFGRELCRPRRIIPARAGFTRRASWMRRLSRDHPRSRGVYGVYGTASTMVSGSSPLARGLRNGR